MSSGLDPFPPTAATIMPVATSTLTAGDKLNTVAVVPIEAAGTNQSLSFLRTAASNLVHAIAQGSTSAATQPSLHTDSDEGEEQGASSFTYTAPQTSNSQCTWYVQVPWHISNRYYDVDVTLKALRPELLSVSETQSSTSPRASLVLADIPAYVVLVDRSKSLEDHRRNVQQMEGSIASGFEAEISIVAGVSSFSSSSAQVLTEFEAATSRQPASAAPSISDLASLYSDAGWEFIAIDDDDDISTDTDSSDEEDQGVEQDGVERIREALQNYMWSGLTRKEDHHAAARAGAASGTPGLPFSSRGFSNTLERGGESDDEEDDEAEPAAIKAEPALPDLPVVGSNHSAPGDLDEQLANLFLSSRGNLTDLAELEAFLESEDPSWPANASSAFQAGAAGRTDAAVVFDNNFDDFLPFQSAEPASTTNDKDDDLFPDESEIASMQNTLFGSHSASSQKEEAHDLGAQLHQLQWHAQRVRTISDPDKRRKEAALIALAFSMQWGTDSPSTTADPKLQF